MANYEVTFKVCGQEKFFKIKVKAEGIIPAIKDAIDKKWSKAWNVNYFTYPVKAEEV